MGITIVAASMAIPSIAAASTDVPEESISHEIAAYFDKEVVAQVQNSLDSERSVPGLDADVPEFSGELASGTIHQVFAFSIGFLEGDEQTEPVVESDEWMSSLVEGRRAVGTARVWTPDDGDPQLAEFSSDGDLGAALSSLDSESILVEDAPNGVYFAIRDDKVRVLYASAGAPFPGEIPLAQAQELISEAWVSAGNTAREMANAAEGADVAVGGGGLAAQDGSFLSPGIIGGLCLVALGTAGFAVVMVRARRRTTE